MSLLSVSGAPTARVSAPPGPALKPRLVAELDAGAAAEHDVDLLLLGVQVAEGHAEVRRELEVAHPGPLEAERLAGEAGLHVGRVAEALARVLDVSLQVQQCV